MSLNIKMIMHLPDRPTRMGIVEATKMAIWSSVNGGARYYQNAEAYDEYVNKWMGREKISRDISAVVAHSSPCPDTVVEIGAGTGSLSRQLALIGGIQQLFITDVSSTQLDFARRIIPSNRDLSIQSYTFDMNDNWPFRVDTADVIVTQRANRYIRDYKHWLDQCARTLKSGGVLVWPIFPKLDQFPWFSRSRYGLAQPITPIELRQYMLKNTSFKDVKIINSPSIPNTKIPPFYGYQVLVAWKRPFQPNNLLNRILHGTGWDPEILFGSSI